MELILHQELPRVPKLVGEHTLWTAIHKYTCNGSYHLVSILKPIRTRNKIRLVYRKNSIVAIIPSGCYRFPHLPLWMWEFYHKGGINILKNMIWYDIVVDEVPESHTWLKVQISYQKMTSVEVSHLLEYYFLVNIICIVLKYEKFFLNILNLLKYRK